MNKIFVFTPAGERENTLLGDVNGVGRVSRESIVPNRHGTEAETARSEQGIQQGTNEEIPNLSQPHSRNSEEPSQWNACPNVEDGNHSEEESPEDSARQSQNQRQESIDERTGPHENPMRESPTAVEAVVSVRLSKDILEGQLDVFVDIFLVPIQEIETDGHFVVSGLGVGSVFHGIFVLASEPFSRRLLLFDLRFFFWLLLRRSVCGFSVLRRLFFTLSTPVPREKIPEPIRLWGRLLLRHLRFGFPFGFLF